MAKRKRKLNKTVVLILVGVFVACLAMGGYVLHKRRYQWFPRDPEAVMADVKKYKAQGDWKKAREVFANQLVYVRREPKYFHEYARFDLEYLSAKGKELTDAQRRQAMERIFTFLNGAVTVDPKFIESHRLLADLIWSRIQITMQMGMTSADDWTEYIKRASRIIELDPEDHATIARRATAYSALSLVVPGANTDSAIADWTRATQIKPDEPSYWSGLVGALMMAGKTEEAQEVFTQALEKCPGSANLHVQYARYLQQKGDKSQVLEQIQQAIAAEPTEILGHLALAEYCRIGKQYDQALAALLKAQELDNSDDRVYRAMAATYVAKQEAAKAMETIRQGLTIIADRLSGLEDTMANQRFRARLGESKAQLALFLANTLVDQAEAKPDQKEAYIKEARELTADPSLESYGVYRDRVNGRIAFMEKDYDAAINLLEPLQRRSVDYTASMTLIRAYLNKNLFGKAEQVLDRLSAIESMRDLPGVLLYKAVLQMQYRNYSLAQRYLSDLLQKDPQNTQAQSLYATVSDLTGQGNATFQPGPDTSVNMMSKGMLMDEAQTLWVHEDRDEAVQMMEQLRQRLPDDLEVALRLLVMYSMNGQDQEARGIFEQMKLKYPDKADVLDLQQQFLEEKDSAKRLAIRMKIADMTTDPYRRGIEKAMVCLAFRDQAGYVAHLDEALAAKPNDRTALDQLLDIATSRKDWEAAQKLVDQAVAADLDQTGGKVYRARLAMARGEGDNAIALLQEALTANPLHKAARALLGQAFMQANRLNEASEQFSQLRQDDPSYLPAVIGLAVIAERQGDSGLHAKYIEEAYRLAPRDTYVLSRYLNISESSMPLADQIRERERLARRNSSDSDNLVRLAKLYERANQSDRSGALLKAVFDSAPAQNKLAAAQELVSFYARNNRSSEADQLIAAMLESWPDKVGVYIIYGGLLRQVSPELARNAYAKATQVAPDDPRGHYALAMFLSDRAEWAAAAAAMERYLELRGDDDTAREQLARFYINGIKLDQARAMLDQLLSRKPNDPTARTLGAVVLMKQRRVDQALEQLNDILKEFPQFPEALVTRSNLHLFTGQLAQAQVDLETASMTSGSPEITMQLASMHLQAGDKERCASVLRDLLTRPESRTYKPAQRMLMAVYLSQKRWDSLEPLLARVRSDDPNDPAVWLTEAQMWLARSDFPRAVRALEQAMTVAPTSPVVLREYLTGMLTVGEYQKVADLSAQRMTKELAPMLKAFQGRAMVRLNKPAEADQDFIEAICSASPGQLEWVVSQVAQTWEPRQAMAQARRWLDSRGDSLMMYLAAGRLALLANDLQSGSEVLKRALSLAKDGAERVMVNRDLALCYYQAGQFAQAEQTYLAVLEDAPSDMASLNNLSYMYTNNLDQPDKALPHIQKAVQQTPFNADVLDTYGWTLAKLQRPQEAEVFLAQAVQANNSSALSRYHLGWVYEQANRIGDAQRQYQSALAAIAAQPDPELQKLLDEAIQRVQDKLKG